jgi:hypothetical protein
MDQLTRIMISGAGGAGGKYWIAYSDNSGTNEQAQRGNIDSAGNIAAAIRYENYPSINFYGGIFAKYTSSGSLVFQRRFYDGTSGNSKSAVFDSSGNLYGLSFISNQSNLVKYDSSGTLQWQRRLSANSVSPGSVVVDSSDNIYYSFYSNSSSTYRTGIAKYNSSGVLQFQTGVNNYANLNPIDLKIDSSGNCYMVTAGSTSYLFKFNSSGSLLLSRSFTISGSSVIIAAVNVDSGGNIYVAGNIIQSGSNYPVVIKLNSSGTILWQKQVTNTITGVGFTGDFYSIAIDSADSVYLLGTSGYWVKLNSSGTFQFTRRLTPFSASDGRFIIDSADDLYLMGYTNYPGSNAAFFAKLPSDGTLTGTYGGFTYEGYNFTSVSNSSVVANTLSPTNAAGNATEAAGSNTDAAGHLTTTTVQIG